MVKKTVVRKLIRYKRLLEQNGIPVACLIIFGSYAHGTPRAESDIDVCVVSKKLGKDRIEEGKRLFLLAMQIDPLIEPVAYSPEQYRRDRLSPLLHEIRNNGFVISKP